MERHEKVMKIRRRVGPMALDRLDRAAEAIPDPRLGEDESRGFGVGFDFFAEALDECAR